MALDWAAFYVEHRRALVTYSLALTGNSAAAHDLLHDVLLRLLHENATPTHPRAFVLRCLRNRAIDLHRSAGPRPESIDGVQVALFDDTASEPQTHEQIQRVQAALAKLVDGPREVIVLKIFADLKFQEIADVLNRPMGTVTSQYSRGLDLLRQDLEEAINAARR